MTRRASDTWRLFVLPDSRVALGQNYMTDSEIASENHAWHESQESPRICTEEGNINFVVLSLSVYALLNDRLYRNHSTFEED